MPRCCIWVLSRDGITFTHRQVSRATCLRHMERRRARALTQSRSQCCINSRVKAYGSYVRDTRTLFRETWKYRLDYTSRFPHTSRASYLPENFKWEDEFEARTLSNTQVYKKKINMYAYNVEILREKMLKKFKQTLVFECDCGHGLF